MLLWFQGFSKSAQPQSQYALIGLLASSILKTGMMLGAPNTGRLQTGGLRTSFSIGSGRGAKMTIDQCSNRATDHWLSMPDLAGRASGLPFFGNQPKQSGGLLQGHWADSAKRITIEHVAGEDSNLLQV